MKKSLIGLVFILISPIVSFAGTTTHEKLAIYTKNAPAPIGTYSQAIRTENVVYISGQIPMDLKTGELVKGDFKKQVRQVITNLSEITKASGGTLDNIAKITVYVTDLENFSVINEIMSEYFHKPYPARAVIEIKALPKHADIEIEAIMVR